ncbi:hypothetical protein CVD28_19540 [Bacillus sp. M6-12]|uniref:STAS domain-containing protein n=1 Tax=Bacillus sp. M6-12 TaxID=2054166 RepID=UPI000C77BCD9|nr:STAS domain-containing protein [Bacillus sp. M6-12]PLS15938.1 hypothetical protein CVD28_19540 [Bacillus sp. M6-12]
MAKEAGRNEFGNVIIPISRGVALLQIMEKIDTQRSHTAMSQILKKCSEKEIKHLIIDVSGVTFINEAGARSLIQLIQALQLIGVKTIISGIQPLVAQMAIKTGIYFKDLTFDSNVMAALNKLI